MPFPGMGMVQRGRIISAEPNSELFGMGWWRVKLRCDDGRDVVQWWTTDMFDGLKTENVTEDLTPPLRGPTREELLEHAIHAKLLADGSRVP